LVLLAVPVEVQQIFDAHSLVQLPDKLAEVAGLWCDCFHCVFHPVAVEVKAGPVASGVAVDHTVRVDHWDEDYGVQFCEGEQFGLGAKEQTEELVQEMRADNFAGVLPSHEQEDFL
jgi:hypothetical protein